MHSNGNKFNKTPNTKIIIEIKFNSIIIFIRLCLPKNAAKVLSDFSLSEWISFMSQKATLILSRIKIRKSSKTTPRFISILKYTK